MAGKYDDCIDRVVKASGGKLTREQVEEALTELDARAERRAKAGRSSDESMREAAQEMQDAFIERAAVLKRNERMDVLKAIKFNRYVGRAPNAATGFEAFLGGVNVVFEGSRLGIDQKFKAFRKKLGGSFETDLQRNGLDKLFHSKTLEREWAIELHELNKGERGKPGLTQSADALKIAEVIQRHQKLTVETLNGAGGWVKSLTGYIFRNTHDAIKITKAGMDRWADDVLAHLDIRRTFHHDNADQARFELKKMFPQFATGDHQDYSRPLDELTATLGIDLGYKVSAPRELFWKSADDQLAYNAQYGRYNPTLAIKKALEDSARAASLLDSFGSKPKETFEKALHEWAGKLREGGKLDQYKQLEKKEAYLRSLFAQVDGSANRPVNETYARIGSDIRIVQRISKLGLTLLAQLADLATKASELRYQGVSFGERHLSALTDYFKGPMDGEKRQIAELLGHAIDSEIANISAHFDYGDIGHDALARAERAFFRWSLMSAMTYNQRHAAERIMARHMGMQRGKAHAELGGAEARAMKLFDINKAEWELLRKVEWNEIGGKTYLTPEVATRLSDADVKAYLVETGKLHKDASGPAVDLMVKDARDNLGIKLASYFADRGEYAVLEVGARERARLYGGASEEWRPGTVKGEALRLMLQFKAFPTAMIMKTWGRELYGQERSLNQVAGITEFIAYATLLGVAASALNQLVKGQDPLSKWRNKPGEALLAGFIRGGAASIYGDYLLSEFSRHGFSFVQGLAGPTFGQADSLMEIWNALRSGNVKEQTGVAAARLARNNAPFMNLWFTKWGFDALVYWQFAEWMSPGFSQRLERTTKERQGIEYLPLLAPTTVAR
jgi:hypothetical protein